MLSKLHSRSAATAKRLGACYYYKVPDSSPFIRKLSTMAIENQTFFIFLFFLFSPFLSVLTPTLVLSVQRLVFLSLFVVRTAPNMKPLTSTSESNVNSSQCITFHNVK